jgi:hypothetical protein
MSDKNPTVGPEGVADGVASIAAQISSVEKVLTERIDSVRQQLAYTTNRLDQRHDDDWDNHEKLHSQEQEAVRVAVATMDKRLDSMNEFRAQMGDMTRTFATKETVDKAVASLEARLSRMEEDTRRRFEEGGRESRVALRPLEDANAGRGAIIAAIAVVGSILAIIVIVMNMLSL